MRQGLLTAAILIVAWLLWMLRDLVMLIGFAALLAYALDPIVVLVQRIPLPRGRTVARGIAAGVVMLGLVIIVGSSLAGAVPRLAEEITRFVDAAPAALSRLEQGLRGLALAHGWHGVLGAASTGGAAGMPLLLGAVKDGAMSMLSSVFDNLRGLASLFVLPVLTFYLLADRRGVRSSVLALFPERTRPQALRALKAADPALRAYVRGQGLVCLVMGTALLLVLELEGFPVPLLLALLVALAEIIPFIGFAIAATAITVAGFSVSPGLALTGLVSYTIANALLSYLVSPRLLGRHIEMHPFAVIVSVLAGGVLLGPAGGILALPAAAMLRAVYMEFASPRSAKA